ncbi:putative ABC-type transport system, permease component [[Clostridium] ultunense Esp]|uniref:Putative ABC-type transport system, permease component n=1 Tax=[Clostridium] ultunense Esp TaxID=1288971 RepID=M1Z283_9FIRM|nr:ABC transporter permease [Schnuerera ultunensis]CCQ96975.1 putative ABC-type transport system, permease component [[Clostridium] ultunense Esp]SHD76468.1 putative ABC-type transport system, permease component [[Clostridium] ultunense Esp]
MIQLFDIIFSTGFFHSILRVSTPIIFAGLAAVYSERSGVINVSIEGVMLTGALSGVVISALTRSLWISILGTILICVLMALILGLLTLNLEANSIMSGLAINILAQGGTIFILYILTGSKGNSALLNSMQIPNVELPFIKEIPVIGHVLSGQNILTYVAIIVAFVSHVFLFRTATGVAIRSAGENPDALISVGINVKKVRFIALTISGILSSLAGIFLSMGYMNGFTANMTAGRGFIGIAANAMGNQLPLGTLFASLIFGAADSAANALQVLKIPTQFIQMIPYITTILGVFIYSVSTSKRKRREG